MVSDGAAVSAAAAVSITVNALRGFSEWMGGYDHSAGPDMDSDGDTIGNAVEFVIGGNPVNHADNDLLPTLAMVNADPDGNSIYEDYLVFTYRRTDMAKYDPQTTIIVEWAANTVGAWSDVSMAPGVVTIEEKVAAEAGVDLVNVYIPRALSSEGKMFVRLGVVVNTP
jgi:hypothetical protein